MPGRGAHHTFESSEQKRLDILAVDFASAFLKFTDEFPNPRAVTLELFADFFHEQKLEYLYYAGTVAAPAPGEALTVGADVPPSSSALPTSSLSYPYSEVVVGDVLQLCAAYLAFPAPIARPHTRLFGLLMCYYMYATQPQLSEDACLPPCPIFISVDTLEALASLLEEAPLAATARASAPDSTLAATANPKAALPSSLLALGIGLGASQSPSQNSITASSSSLPILHTSASAAPSSVSAAVATGRAPLTAAEKVAFLSLHKYHAWQPQPFHRNHPHVYALIKAHEALGAAASVLLPESQRDEQRRIAEAATESAGTSRLMDSASFKGQLEDYERMLGELTS